MRISSSRFIKSASHIDQSPEMDVDEIAIIGRSNVGKSTLINFLTNRKDLAKASKTPGKTQLINFFLINELWMLVDFPGYGYAKKGHDMRARWLDVMQEYLTEKGRIRDVLLLINGHLPLQKMDMIMIEALAEGEIPFTVVVTKIDKASLKEVNRNMKSVRAFIAKQKIDIPVFLMTSSAKKQGMDGLLRHIESKLQT